MLAQRSRQLHRQMIRAAEAAVERAPLARPTWGDRRLNRKKRFALIALREHLRRLGLLMAGLTDPVVARLAKDFGLPELIVRELGTPNGNVDQLGQAA